MLVAIPVWPTTTGAFISVPSEPRHLVADLVQRDPLIAQVTWYTPEEPNGEIQSYKLYWGVKGDVYTAVVFKAHQQTFYTPPIGNTLKQITLGGFYIYI